MTITRRAVLCGLIAAATPGAAAIAGKLMAPTRPVVLDPVPVQMYAAQYEVGDTITLFGQLWVITRVVNGGERYEVAKSGEPDWVMDTWRNPGELERELQRLPGLPA